MDPFTSAHSALHYALEEFRRPQRKTTENMVKYNETTIKKRTEHELE